MPRERVRVLLVEDDPDDALLARELAADVPGSAIELDWISDFDEGLAALARGEHDACLLDYRLGARDGLDFLRGAATLGCKAPVILLTGQGDRDTALRALDEGAADYLVKDKLDAMSLERTIRYALQQWRNADELERRVRQRTSELEEAHRALQLADQRKAEFLAMLAHELRNPLASITNSVHVLKSTKGKPPVVDTLSDILSRQVTHMNRLVDDLIDIKRVDEGKLELRLAPIELNTAVAKAVESCQPTIDRLGHRVDLVPWPEPIALRADGVRLAQVIGNLVVNACKFTEAGGQIVVGTALEGADAVVRVRDTGVGIAPEHLDQIFEMFAQVNRAAARTHGGLGIGLTLVRQIAELHGGSVTAASDGLGRGSEFVVRLPAKGPAAPLPDAPASIPELDPRGIA